MDATEYVLVGGRKCVIFQLIDDHSRFAVASHVAWEETADGAINVVDKATAAHGVPQRLLSDNGVALNPCPTRVRRSLETSTVLTGGVPVTDTLLTPDLVTSRAKALETVVNPGRLRR